MNATDFVEWLKEQMGDKGLSQADLAHKSGVSTAQVSKILNRQSFPGIETCRALARALGLPPETIFREIGYLPKEGKKTSVMEEVSFLMDQLTEEEQEFILTTARAIAGRRKKTR